MLKMLINQH